MKILTLILMLCCIFDTMATEDTMEKKNEIFSIYHEKTIRKHIQMGLKNPKNICHNTGVQQYIPLSFKSTTTPILERSNGDKYRILDIIKLFDQIHKYSDLDRTDSDVKASLDAHMLLVIHEDEIFDVLDKHQGKIQRVEIRDQRHEDYGQPLCPAYK